MPIYFYWFRCIIRFWNSLQTSNNSLLRSVVQADLRLIDRKGSWTHEVMTALNDVPDTHNFAAAIRTQATINVEAFEAVLRHNIIQEWQKLDNLPPQEAHPSSRIMRTYHTHFGTPLGNIPGYWDEKRNKKPTLPLYLRHDIPHQQLRSLSCLRLSSHSLRVESLRQQTIRRPYELRVCNKCDWHTVQDEEHVILDCPSSDLTHLRHQFRHLFQVLPADSTTRLKDFINQPDTLGVAMYVHKCLDCCV